MPIFLHNDNTFFFASIYIGLEKNYAHSAKIWRVILRNLFFRYLADYFEEFPFPKPNTLFFFRILFSF